jgi:hypothetical protein
MFGTPPPKLESRENILVIFSKLSAVFVVSVQELTYIVVHVASSCE